MAEETVEAIVLRRRESGESDRRLTLLTNPLGKVDAVAKGARKAASRLAGVSDPLTVAVFEFAAGKRNRFVTQAQPIRAFRGLRTDYDRLSYALAFAELVETVLPWEEPAPDVFELTLEALIALEEHPKPLVALVWATVRLIETSGFMPSFLACVVTGVPIQEAQAFVSVLAGGYVVHAEAGRFPDRTVVAAEVLVGLGKVGELEAPPPNLKQAAESFLALLPFVRNALEAKLAATEAVARELRHGPSEGGK